MVALGLAHRFEDAGLGDAPEVVVDRRPPARRYHVEADRTREPVRLGKALLDAMHRNARATIAVALLEEGIHAERDAMREQGRTPVVVEIGKPVPKRLTVLGQLRLPGLLAVRDRLGREAVLQVGRLNGEEHMAHRNLKAGAWRAMLEGVEAELVQQHRHGDVRVARHRVPQCQGAVRGELA
jgi:hypothetical protein